MDSIPDDDHRSIFDERGRLYDKIVKLWEEDNAMYPADDDGRTGYPVWKTKAFVEAMLLAASITVLQMYRRDKFTVEKIAKIADQMGRQALNTLADAAIAADLDEEDP